MDSNFNTTAKPEGLDSNFNTPQEPALFSLSQKSYMMLALLGLLSVLGHYCSLPLFFGVDFIFGSIAVLLTIHLFGVRWGVAIALLGSSYTFFLWEHPYDIIIYTFEALFIGFTWKRYTHNMLLLEGIFWLCVAAPLIWLLYTFVIPLETTHIVLIILKKLVNGLANASIACLIIIFVPLTKWIDLPNFNVRPSLRQILLNLMTTLVLLPALLIITINGWLITNKIEQEIKRDLNILSKNIITDFQIEHHRQSQSLQKLAQFAAQTYVQNATHLKQHATQILDLFPEFLNITLTDVKGNVLINYQRESSDLNIQSQLIHLPFLQQVLTTTSQIRIFHSTLTKNGTVTPILAHFIPIQSNGQIIGAVVGYFNLLDMLYKLHAIQYPSFHKAHVTLVDERGIILDNTQQNLKLLKYHGHTPDISKTWLKSAIYPVFPKETTHTLQRWYNATYVQHTPISKNLPVTIVVEMPLRGYIDSWQQIYINQLVIIAIIALLALILAIVISRWLVAPLLQLTHITKNLSTRIEKNQEIQWPNIEVREINFLTKNFKLMAKSLQGRFDEMNEAKVLLEERVQTRTQELLHERALLRNLIDSVPDFIFYKDCHSMYLGCNKAFEEFVGCSEADIIGQTDFGLFSVEMAHFLGETDKQVLTSSNACTHEEWCCCYPMNRWVSLETLKTPFLAADGKLLGLIGISRDTTIHRKAEEALHQSQEMLRLVIDNIPQFIFWKDKHGVYLGSNQNFAQIVGLESPKDIVGKTNDDLRNNEQYAGEAFFETINRCITADGKYEYQKVELILLADGTPLYLDMNKIPLFNNQGHNIGVLGCLENITQRKRVEKKLKQSSQVFENCAEAIIITNAKTQFTHVNKAFTQITGYTEAEVLGKKPSMLRSEKHDTHFYKRVWGAINSTGYWEGEIWNRRKDGEVYPEWLHISVIKDETNNQITNYLGIFSDLTLRKQTEQRLIYLAHYDELTGLPNRTLFYEHVTRAIFYAQQHNTKVAVMFLDLDGFKYINDTWGYMVGDLLLKQVTKRITTDCPCKTILARLGGDDFTITLENINHLKDVEHFVQNILEIMQKPFYLNGHETFITASIGISLYPNDGRDVDTLLKNADTAMYRAKEGGKNHYQFFTAQMNINVHKRVVLESKLRHALEREEFVLYYQPQKHLASGNIVGAEVLLRWQHPEMGLVLPYTFIPLAEETGLIVPIGEWVLHQTCLQYQNWHRNVPILRRLRMSVNLSTRQFKQNDLINRVVKIIEETKIDPTLLELELTESFIVQHFDLASKILNQFKDMGIHLALDDFGTGYSSLSYLKRFPIDTLKIDQSFVRDIPMDKDDMNITRAIVALAHSLEMNVIAEGVETESQQAFLKSLECDEVQGYLIGHPLPEDKFLKLFTDVTH